MLVCKSACIVIICCRTKCYAYIQDCEIMFSACEKSIILSAGNVPVSLFSASSSVFVYVVTVFQDTHRHKTVVANF